MWFRFFKEHSIADLILSIMLLVFISGCGGSSEEDAPIEPPPPPPQELLVSVEQSARFLTQSTFGTQKESINYLSEIGYDAWLNEQFALTATLHRPLVEEYPDDDDLNQGHRYEVWWRTVLTSDDQLRQRVAWALSQIFVISDKSNLVLYPYAIAGYYDILVQNAFGNYRDLLEEVTLSPMMGVYLSMLGNEKPNTELNIRPDENYAREVMQLFSIGLVKLNTDGSIILDSNSQPIPTYDQDTIKGFAHVFTGWSFANGASWYEPSFDLVNSMTAYEDFHDTGEKQLLDGFIIDAGSNAQSDLDAALDNIFNHPNVGPFISYQLIQRLVTSNPTSDYIERVASVFNNNGQGIRGDLKAVITAVLMDDEAISEANLTNDNFGKLKEPLLRFSQMWRAFDASAESGKYWFDFSDFLTGQAPLSAPSVFNFYSPSFQPSGEISDAELVAPEFQILNESYITHTLNWIAGSTYVGYKGLTGPDYDEDRILIDITEERILVSNPAEFVEHLNLLLLSGQMEDNMKTELIASIEAIPESEDLFRVVNTLFLVLSSPQFSVQR